MSLQLEPLPGDVAHLLLRGATQLEPSAHTRSRLRERLTAEMRSQGGATLALAPRESLWSQPGNLAGVLRNRLLVGIGSFALGAGMSALLRPAAYRAPIAPPAPAVAAAPLAAAALPVIPQPAPVVAVPPLAPRPHHVSRMVVAIEPTQPIASTAPLTLLSPTAPKSELRLEGELLERGRIAMVRGDAEGALAAADEHALRFPSGKLAEEREALRVEALASEDCLTEARVALSAFRRAYPQSLVGPALEAAIAGR